MRKITPILKSLGLMDSEISTYLTVLKLGPSTVIEIASSANLSRQAVYTAIDLLTERGLMSSVTQGKRNLYTAESPAKLLAYARRKNIELNETVNELSELLPDLELRVNGERPIVKVFKGKEGIKTIIQDIEESSANDSYEITDVDAMYRVLKPDDLKEMRNKLKKKKRQVFGIYADSQARESQRVTPEWAVLGEDDSGFESNIGIYGNKVIMVTFHGKMYSVEIDSEPLAQAMRILFVNAYDNLKKNMGK
jgi:predicted transcriptional regulator